MLFSSRASSLEDGPAAGPSERRRARVELEAAALGGNRDTKRIAREDRSVVAPSTGGDVRPVRHSSQVP